MARKGNPNYVGTKTVHLLRYESSNGETLYFGPFPADTLLSYYYDELGEELKKKGALDSSTMSEAKMKKLGPVQSAEVWERQLQLLIKGESRW